MAGLCKRETVSTVVAGAAFCECLEKWRKLPILSLAVWSYWNLLPSMQQEIRTHHLYLSVWIPRHIKAGKICDRSWIKICTIFTRIGQRATVNNSFSKCSVQLTRVLLKSMRLPRPICLSSNTSFLSLTP